MILLHIFITASILCLLTLSGYALLSALFRHSRPTFSLATIIALSYTLGLGTLSHLMLFLGWLRLPLTGLTINSCLLLYSFTLFLFIILTKGSLLSPLFDKHVFFKKQKLIPSQTDPASFALTGLTYTLLILICGIVFLRAVLVPIYSWDSIATAALSAKTFFYDQSLLHHPFVHHANYPLQVPLALTWFSLNFGHWEPAGIKIFFPLIFFSMLAVINASLKKYLPRNWVNLGLILFISSNFYVFHATIAYRDILLSFYTCTPILLLLLWQKERQDAYLFLCSILIGFGTFTKTEGYLYLIAHMLLFSAVLIRCRVPTKDAAIKMLKYVVPSAMLVLFYLLYKFSAGVPLLERTSPELSLQSLKRIPALISLFVRTLSDEYTWNMVWGILGLSVLFRIDRIRQNWTIQFLLLGIFVFSMAHLCLAAFTVNYPIYLAEVTRARMFLHFYPLAPIAIVFLNAPEKKEEECISS